MVAFVLSMVAAIGFLVATLLVDTTLGRSRWFHHLSVVIAAGILLGVAFADLLPESFEQVGTTRAAISIAVGFLALFLVEALTSAHTHHFEPHQHGHAVAHGHGHSHSHGMVDDHGCVPRHAVLPFLIGLGLHNLTDGVAIGASHELSDSASSGVAVGILVHQLPVGISFAAVLVASGIASATARRHALVVAAMIPVGTLLMLAIPLEHETLASLGAFAGGALLYIAAGHLLPEAQSEHRRPAIAIAFAASLLGTVLLVGALH